MSMQNCPSPPLAGGLKGRGSDERVEDTLNVSPSPLILPRQGGGEYLPIEVPLFWRQGMKGGGKRIAQLRSLVVGQLSLRNEPCRITCAPAAEQETVFN